MARRVFTVVACLVAIAAVFLTNPPPAPTRAPSMGLIEHRGQFYRFEDLMDPAFRAASNDPFVQRFGEPGHFATPWAGQGDPRETLADIQIRQVEIWQNQTLSIDIHQVEGIQDRLPALPWAGDGPYRED